MVGGLHQTFGVDAAWTAPYLAPVNARTLAQMVPPGHAMFTQHRRKLALALGGLWWMLPWTWPRQSTFIRRTAWVRIPARLASAWRGILGGVRLDAAKWIPIAGAPAAVALVRLGAPALLADTEGRKTLSAGSS